MSTKDKVPFFVAQCEDMGIEVLPPDVNESGHDFMVVEGNIRFGLDAVKNVGCGGRRRDHRGARGGRAVHARSGTSARGSTASAVNKKAIESLVKCGALDSTGGHAHGHAARACRRRRRSGQKAQQDALHRAGLDLRPRGAGAGGGRRRSPAPPRPAGPARWRTTAASCNAMEKETLGLFLSSHPLKEVRPALRARVDCSLAELGEQEGRRVGHGRRHDHRVQADPHQEGRPDDVRHARRPRGPGRDARLQLRLRGERGQGRRRQGA